VDRVNGDGLVLTHGAGSDRDAPLLVALDAAFAARGVTVLRLDLPFRERRRRGPPRPGEAAADRAGLRRAVEALRGRGARRVYLGGHSYGGRQATMLAAEEPALADALLLLSYPLHPPARPREARTAHFPALRIPALFVHGTRDAFGAAEALRAALALVPAPTRLVPVEGAGHDLGARGRAAATAALARQVAETFLAWIADGTPARA
jgi:hypothetical protein